METSGRGMGGENAMKIQRVGEELGQLLQHSSAMAADISSGRNNPGWDPKWSEYAVNVDALLQQAFEEITSTGKITRQTYNNAVQAKNIFVKFGHWVRNIFMMEVPDDDEGSDSDIRLKENITRTGVSKSGIPTYTFNYKNDNTLWSGTMAQDLLEMGMGDAVTINENGYYSVYYDMIDVDMVRKN